MNPMLKIAYDYGCRMAVEDFEKSASIRGELGSVVLSNPLVSRGALTGSALGGLAGAITGDEEDRLERFLTGAAGGALLGAGSGKYMQEAVDKDLVDALGLKDLSRLDPRGVINATSDPRATNLAVRISKRLKTPMPSTSAGMADMINKVIDKDRILKEQNLASMRNAIAASLAGGLGSNYLMEDDSFL
jgi:hypothetical protein